MRAVVMTEFGGPEVLSVGQVDEPLDKAGWVNVELRASALNWHDLLVRQGKYDSPLPHIPGADGAGVRTDTGEEVVILPSMFWGDRPEAPGREWEILGDTHRGTYAEVVSVPEECVAPKPAHYSWEEAAAFALVGVTSYRALATRANLKPGESILIIGAGGGVATTALKLARALGAEVTVTGSTEEKIQLATEAGASGGVLHHADNWPEQAKRLSPRREGFDVVLDPVGLWEKSLGALRPGGRLVTLGANVADQAQLSIRPFYFGQYSLLGTTMGGLQDFAGLLELTNAQNVAVDDA